jgi:hypothetical protein
MSSVSQSLPQPKHGVPPNRRQGVDVLAGARLCLISEDMDYPGADLEGFDALFRREYPAIVRTAYGVLGDRQGAEDVAQEAFARL